MGLKTIYIITTGNCKIDRVEEAFFYSPLVTTNLLRSFRCVQSIIGEHAGEPTFKVEYSNPGPIGMRKKLKHLDYLKNTDKPFHNLPIAKWKLTGINQKTKQLLHSDYREIAITAFRIEID